MRILRVLLSAFILSLTSLFLILLIISMFATGYIIYGSITIGLILFVYYADILERTGL